MLLYISSKEYHTSYFETGTALAANIIYMIRVTLGTLSLISPLLACATLFCSNSYAEATPEISNEAITAQPLVSVQTDDSIPTDVTPPPPLNWYGLEQLTDDEREGLPSFCSGIYRPSGIEILPNNQIQADANEASMSKTGDVYMLGNVVFRQQDRVLYSDKALWLQNDGEALMEGNIQIDTPTVSVNGTQARYHQARQESYVDKAEFSILSKHLRGTAEEFLNQNSQLMTLGDASLTFCEPGNNDWSIAASKVRLDQSSGIGSAWHSRFRVKDVPVFYLPYYRFPIGDQRMTGFLDPSISISSKLGGEVNTLQAEDIQIPFYINIAPQMDATITAHHVLDHGMLWENQFRHKTKLLGNGELNFGYLAKDQQTKEERWLVNYKQAGKWGNHWTHNLEYNNLSDKRYQDDLNSIYRTSGSSTHVPSRGRINYQNSDALYGTSLSGSLLFESFNTIDERLALSSRPYRRLPQLALTWKKGNRLNEYFKQQVQLTRFNRESTGLVNDQEQVLSGFRALNSHRLVSETSLSYPQRWPFGYLTPKAEYRYRSYHLYDEEVEDIEPDYQFSTPRLSLNGGIALERQFEALGSGFTQTLEPRFFYVYSPYRENQTDIPLFDTKATNITYNSLFYGDRFTGYDRLADLNQISGGVTNRLINEDGLEQFRFSVGRIWYLEDRRVTLRETDPENLDVENLRRTSSSIGEAEWNLNESLSVFSFAEWDPYQDYAVQERYGVRYFDKQNHMLSVTNSQTESRNDEGERNNYTNQLDISFFWSLNDQWAVFGKQLRDLRTYEDNETRPEDRMLEVMAGLEFQNCCWRAQFVYRELSRINRGITEEDPFGTNKRFGWLLSIQLKGLTTIGANMNEILNENIYGYSRRLYYDH